MQCNNCQFHNMPGSEVCGRCGSSLALATAVIDVHPPRAGRLSKRMRRVVPASRAYFAARDALGDAAGAVVTHLPAPPPPRVPLWSASWRLVAPGWSHFYLGQRARGHGYLWSFLACLIPGLLLLGSTWGSLWLGMAFSVHSTEALDVVNQAYQNGGVRDRILRSIVVSIALAVALYLPAWWLLSRVADPHTLEVNAGPFRPGDVVLVNQLTGPRVGQVVLYEIPTIRLRRLNPGGHGLAYFEFAGDRIDRILAGPGDKVVWESGRLTINGAPSPWLPLDPRNVPPRLALTMGTDSFLILPSTTPEAHGDNVNNLLGALSTVPRENIRGRAYVLSQPLTRFRVLD